MTTLHGKVLDLLVVTKNGVTIRNILHTKEPCNDEHLNVVLPHCCISCEPQLSGPEYECLSSILEPFLRKFFSCDLSPMGHDSRTLKSANASKVCEIGEIPLHSLLQIQRCDQKDLIFTNVNGIGSLNLFIQNEGGNTTLNNENRIALCSCLKEDVLMLLLRRLKVMITTCGADVVPKEKRRCIRLAEEPETMTELPHDVLINVLIRSPAKQLAQLRCVSKHWNAFLSQRYFIKSHVDFHHSNNDEILLVFLHGGFTTHHSKSPHIELSNFIKLPVNFPSAASSEYIVIGSINGLICISCGSAYDFDIYIWNPSISAVMTLPPYSTTPSPINPKKNFFRFGFDPKTDDYKVILFTCSFQLPGSAFLVDFPGYLQLEMYSIRKGSWELITQRFPLEVKANFDEDQDCIDGRDGYVHWLCQQGKLERILAFDLCSETFTLISLPDSVTDLPYSYYNKLGVLSGKLCVMSSVTSGEWDVWVMNEYGVAESWTKNHVFSLFSDCFYPYGFTLLNNELLFRTHSNLLTLYDPIADKVKLFEDILKNNPLCKFKFVSYVESLVWVESNLPSKKST